MGLGIPISIRTLPSGKTLDLIGITDEQERLTDVIEGVRRHDDQGFSFQTFVP